MLRSWRAGCRGVQGALLVAAVVLAGCGGGGEEAATTGEATQTGATTETGQETGHDLFLQAGCGSCHGDNAQGTQIALALPGHSEEVVMRQVRAPLDKMPSYSQEQLSDEGLHEIAEYIASLAPTEMHMEPVKLSDVVSLHHWMALSAIEAGNLDDALHHVDHIIQLVKGKHLAVMKEAREHLEAGDTHEAEHLIEDMLAGNAKPDLTLSALHLKLALAAVEADDVEDAVHHTRHFLKLARGHDKSDGREVLAALERGDLHEAEDELEHLLEEEEAEG